MTTSPAKNSPGFLHVYSGILTLVFAWTVITGMTRSGPTRFDVIDVERVNIVEPDGTLRMVLSNKAKFPGLVLKKTEYEHPSRRVGGMLFFNDEGTETGGLIFGGARDSTGHVDAFTHLSFDQYEQDQVITLNATESGSNRKAAVSVWDRPDWSTEDLMQVIDGAKSLPDSQRSAVIREFFATRESAHPRMYLGKTQNGSVSLRLNDAEGRERLVVEVQADGSAAIRFLDEEGEETARFPATGPK